jgi:hypothetical protein
MRQDLKVAADSAALLPIANREGPFSRPPACRLPRGRRRRLRLCRSAEGSSASSSATSPARITRALAAAVLGMFSAEAAYQPAPRR